MLPAVLLLVSLAQEPAPALSWWIEGIYGPNMLVTVRPPRELASVKAIALDPVPTRDDPKPRSIQPTKTESTPDGFGLRAWFAALRRRFHLRVTLSDGSTHKIDIYAAPPPGNKPKIYETRPLLLIAPQVKWA